MFKREFIYREDRDYGSMGWAPAHQPMFNTSAGLGVAHDTLEHFAGDDQSWEGEFRAFGSILWIRGVGGYFYSLPHNPNPAYHMSGDISRFIRDMLWQGKVLKEPPRSRALNEDAEAILQEALRLARKDFAYEHRQESPQYRSRMADFRRELLKAEGWIRFGYRKAVRRWRGNDSTEVAWLFDQIEREVNRRKHAEEGDKLIVRVSPSKLTYQIELRSLADEEPDYY